MNSKFICKRCNFITYDKKDYQRHCKTLKHKKSKWTCKDCGKQYKYASGLSRHKCKKASKNIEDDEMENLIIQKQDTNSGNNFNELLTIIKEQQKQLNKSHELIQKVIKKNKDIIPRIGNNNISINVYLNEQCKDIYEFC